MLASWCAIWESRGAVCGLRLMFAVARGITAAL